VKSSTTSLIIIGILAAAAIGYLALVRKAKGVQGETGGSEVSGYVATPNGTDYVIQSTNTQGTPVITTTIGLPKGASSIQDLTTNWQKYLEQS